MLNRLCLLVPLLVLLLFVMLLLDVFDDIIGDLVCQRGLYFAQDYGLSHLLFRQNPGPNRT